MEKFIKEKINRLNADQQSIAHLAYKAGYSGDAYYNYNLPKSYYGQALPQDKATADLWDKFWSEGKLLLWLCP